jgi:hypothetical protein
MLDSDFRRAQPASGGRGMPAAQRFKACTASLNLFHLVVEQIPQ